MGGNGNDESGRKLDKNKKSKNHFGFIKRAINAACHLKAVFELEGYGHRVIATACKQMGFRLKLQMV